MADQRRPSFEQFDLKPSTIRFAFPDHVLNWIDGNEQRKRRVIAAFTRAHGDEARSRLARFLNQGRCPEATLRRLQRLTCMSAWSFDCVLENTRAQVAQVAAGRRSARVDGGAGFVPYIQVRNNLNRRRAPLFMLAIAGTHDRIAVPADLPSRPRDGQLAVCRRLIAAFPATQSGQLNAKWLSPPYGYAYRKAPRETWEFTPAGELVQVHRAYVHAPSARLTVGPETGRRGKGA